MQRGGEILYVGDGVAVRGSAAVQGPVVSTGAPVAWCFLGHHVKWGCPVAGRWLNDANSSMCSNSWRATRRRSGDRRRGRADAGGPVVSM